MALCSAEVKAVLTLNRLTDAYAYTIDGIGDMFSSAGEFLEQYHPEQQTFPPRIRQRLCRPITSDTERLIEADRRWLEAPNHHLISYFDAAYPALLRQIPDPPLCLYAIGNIALLHQPQIAIVGSRKATQSGLKIAFEFARLLSELGLVITSGLAHGIDGAAHKGSLAKSGQTIAVLGCGVDLIYPRLHERLALNIMQQGLLVSEYPLGSRIYAKNFPQRNRIITGLSLGTLIVEAALRSGSLISARLAMEYGREVFAVPGSIYSPLSAGCHQLIKDGAKLVHSIEDIVEEIAPSAMPQDLDVRSNLTKTECQILGYLSADPVTIDEICSLTKMPVSELSCYLIKLELEGLVMEQGIGIVLARPQT